MTGGKTRSQDQSRYLSEDTIAAFSTPLGGAVAVLRMSGPRSVFVLEQMLALGWMAGKEPRKLYRGPLFDLAKEILDDPLIAFFKSPSSFTGEDCVEIHVHGSSAVATRLFDVLHELGVRQALPGEFSFRAVRNGKLSLAQAEATADLIASSNPDAAKLALEKMSGTQNRLVAGIAESLRTIATLGEAGIDFSDQDLEEVSLPSLRKRIAPVCEKLETLRASYGRGLRVQEGVSVAFVGLPNAGKSSFFNALLGEDRSIVSEVAGTTRDVVRERLTLRGKKTSVTLRLEDTAGLRPTEDRVEKIGIERTQRVVLASDLVLLIVDGSLDDDGFALSLDKLRTEWTQLGRPSAKTLGVVTKIDLAANSLQIEAHLGKLTEFGISRWLRTSATESLGVTEAAASIADFCESWIHRTPSEVLLTRLDHVRATEAALLDLDRALQAPALEFFAADVRQSLHSLSPMIGDTVPDDILGRIFSEFCIGK